jgi:uncharacterized protein YbjT (DUF2867 family)
MNNHLKIAVIIGATGLVGSKLLEFLLQDKRYSKIKVFHRRPTGISNSKLEEYIINFDSPETWKDLIIGDELYSTLGTTLKTAGSKEAQYKVDFEYQFQFAKYGLNNDIKKYALVSSMGANTSTSNFYLKMKGSLDDAISHLGFEKLLILRPSLLLGDPKKKRLGERISEPMLKIVTKLPILRNYAPIHALDVAKAMINGMNSELSQPIYEGEEVKSLAALH